MKRRIDSMFASGALLLLLSLTLLYGCRAFDPEPVVVNRAPDTYLTGAPAETTGSGFRRHLYWYGTDRDGEVVQYIYAVTDSLARDISEPTIDEEDELFNPALDVTTLRNSNVRQVGWTTQTDSIFEFTVDRGSTPSKEITFHIVSVDDRGAIDPTPARLRFFNNTLGNPTLRFSVYVNVDAQGNGGELRWVGTPFGPDPTSPEQTSRPFVGFRRPFRIEWEASSPNFEAVTGFDGIIGYRVKASQGPGSYTPPLDEAGEKQWSLNQRRFVYLNERPASDPEVGNACSPTTGIGCDPRLFRFPSGPFSLSVEVIDRALVESTSAGGFLRFEVNYPPESEILVDGTTPSFVVRDGSGAVLRSGVITPASGSRLDTIPVGALVTVRSSGYDRFTESVPPGEQDLLCCDTPLEAVGDTSAIGIPEVRYQTRVTTVRREAAGDAGIPFTNSFSTARDNDDITFEVGPLDYTVISRTLDEHRRPDPTPATFDFVSGFRPRIVPEGFVPGPTDLDSLIIRFPLPGVPPWPSNEVPYTNSGTNVDRWWVPQNTGECGGSLLATNPQTAQARRYPGQFYRFRPIFEGAPDPRDPLAAVKAWAFAFNSDADPFNQILTGRESPELNAFVDSPTNDVWQWSVEDAIEIWIPNEVFFTPDLFDPGIGADAASQSVGCLLRKEMGEITMRVVGRTTRETDSFPLYAQTRNDSTDNYTALPIGRYGRKTVEFEFKFWIYIGLGLGDEIERLWPGF